MIVERERVLDLKMDIVCGCWKYKLKCQTLTHWLLMSSLNNPADIHWIDKHWRIHLIVLAWKLGLRAKFLGWFVNEVKWCLEVDYFAIDCILYYCLFGRGRDASSGSRTLRISKSSPKESHSWPPLPKDMFVKIDGIYRQMLRKLRGVHYWWYCNPNTTWCFSLCYWILI